MTRIDGLIILDTNGKPLITSHFPLHPPSYPSVHIDTYNHALKKARVEGKELEPAIWVQTLVRGGMAGAGLCHLEREGLRYLIPVGQEVNPLFAFSFLDAFLATLRDYLGEVTETSIKDNFDIVYMLIEEMLDEGHPMTMETAMLKDIVLPPTLMRKILNVAGVTGIQSPASAPFTAPIPWRRQGVRHTNNEIYFDIEESLDAILDRKGNVLSSATWGKIRSNSKLTGNPDLLLTFANPNIMSNCAFHPCIRYNKWEKNRSLSFIPPDGRFLLLEYEAEAKAQMPLSVKVGLSLEANGGTFSLMITSRVAHHAVEDIVVSIDLGKGASSVSATATGDRRPLGASLGPGGAGRKDESGEGWVGGGSWEFDPNTQLLKWTVSSLTATERPASLTGSFVTTETPPTPSPAFNVSFNIPNHCFSGLRVDQLKVLGDVMYKPFKGVRMSAKSGKMEVRW